MNVEVGLTDSQMASVLSELEKGIRVGKFRFPASIGTWRSTGWRSDSIVHNRQKYDITVKAINYYAYGLLKQKEGTALKRFASKW